MTAEATITTGERADLLEALNQHRYFLRFTARDLTDEQANQRTTVSALCIGGLIKHVATVEENWVDFILHGPDALGKWADVDWETIETSDEARQWDDGFRLVDGETLASVLERYESVAKRTNEVVRTLPSLDFSHPLPEAPWFEQGARWSARRTILHIIAETAQHAGHADIIRESLDGRKTMG